MGNKHHKGRYYAFRHEVVSSLTRDSDHMFSDVTDRQLNGLVFLDAEALSAQRHTEQQQHKADGLIGLWHGLGHN